MSGISDITTSFFQVGASAMQSRMLTAAMKVAESNPEAQSILANALVESGKALEAAASSVARSGAALSSGLGVQIDRSI